MTGWKGLKEDGRLDIKRVDKGVYPQNHGSLEIVDIDASKGFIDLWVHFFVAIEDNYFDRKGVFLVSTKFEHV